MSELSYPKTDENEKVLCQICGKSFETITWGHLNMHNVKMADYRLRFPDAPLVSSRYKAKLKYAQTEIFKKKKSIINSEEIIDLIDIAFPEESIIKREEITDIVHTFPEEIFVEEEPIFEEIEMPSKETDPIKNKKSEILNILKKFYMNVQENYLIRKLSSTNHLEYEFISDFADPILKVNIQFPKTFWHNKDLYIDLQRNQKLMENGWKIIEIYSLSPSEIEKAIFDSA